MCLFFCVFSLHFQTTTRPLFINLFHTANTGTLCSQQEPYFVVSRNPMKSAGTLCGQQEPLVVAGTMHGNSNLSTCTAAGTLHGQQEPHNFALRQFLRSFGLNFPKHANFKTQFYIINNTSFESPLNLD